MAAVSGAGGPPEEEYVQVVVGEDGDPGGQMMVVQESAGISSDFLHNIAHTDTVFYVQPDGSLLPGGSLAEETARNRVSLLPEETAGHPGPLKPPTPASQQLRTVAHHVALMQGDSSAVTRILSQKELKSIRVQVPGLPSTENADQVMPEDNGTREDASDHAYVSAAIPSDEIVHAKPQTEQAPQPPISPPSSESPFQVLIHQAQLASVETKTQDADKNTGLSEPLDEQRTCAAHPQNGALCAADKMQKKGHKRRKSLKVKTRSGRISRPPKHKAKDYKFLKVGDLVQGSSSDSEDFSELSTEEEDGGGGKKETAPCDLQTYNVKNTLFQCETCEKSYMGKGGLSRHYRLYPSHGKIEPPALSDVRKNGGTGIAGPSAEKKKPIPRPRKRLLEDPLNPIVTTHPTLAQDGFEFVPMSSTCRGRRPMSGRRFGRPRKTLAAAPTIKEMVEQWDDADLEEQVAPSIAKLLSVYDFLLIKVKQDHSDKLLFPLVYKEFEKLHSMVKVLAEEYVSKMVLCTGTERLEVTDSKVAESLGISEEMIISVSRAVSPIVTEKKVQSEEEEECSDKEQMSPSKRFKPAEPEHGNMTGTSEKTPVIHDAEQSDEGDNQVGSSPGNDSGPNAASKEPELVSESPQLRPMDEDAASPQTCSQPVPCERLLETSPSPYNSGPAEWCDNSHNTLCEFPQDNVSPNTHKDETEGTFMPEFSPDGVGSESANLGPLSEKGASSSSENCQQMVEQTAIFTTAEPTAPADEMSSVASPVPPAEDGGSAIPAQDTYCAEQMGADRCTTAFDFNHEHELVFIDSAEETITEDTVLVFDNTESTSTHLATVVALVEM